MREIVYLFHHILLPFFLGGGGGDMKLWRFRGSFKGFLDLDKYHETRLVFSVFSDSVDSKRVMSYYDQLHNYSIAWLTPLYFNKL